MAWNLNLCIDSYGREIVPFCYFVSPQPDLVSSDLPFDGFLSLPVEIQLMVFQYCNPPTLFHLMHTSSHMRQECSKLFWDSMPNVWYQIEPMDSVWDGKMKPLFYCPLFASRVTQVEIDVKISEAIWTPYNGKEFWERIQELFPSVKSVVLTCRDLSDLLFDTDWNTPHHSAAMRMVVGCAPTNITPLIAHGKSNHFALYQMQTECGAGPWHLVQKPWTRTRVMPPPAKWHTGILEDLISSWQLSCLISREQIGLHWLMWETEKYYLENGALLCPRLECERWFRDRETWLVHVSKCGLDRVNIGQDYLPWCRNTGAEVKAILDDRQRRIDQMYKQLKTLIKWLRLQASTPEKGPYRTKWDDIQNALIEQGYFPPRIGDSMLWGWAYNVFCTGAFNFEVLNGSSEVYLDELQGENFLVRNISRRLTFR